LIFVFGGGVRLIDFVTGSIVGITISGFPVVVPGEFSGRPFSFLRKVFRFPAGNPFFDSHQAAQTQENPLLKSRHRLFKNQTNELK
jgi:hypothetical protein